MKRQNVNSSNIKSIGFVNAPNKTGVLEVEFLNGSVYQYLGVPQHLHEQLMSAASHGKFLNTHIKDIFVHRRV